MRAIAGVMLAVGLMAVSPQATSAQDEQAESGASARDLFVQGSSAYRVGNYEAAIEAWQAAYQMDPRPLLLYNLGQANERLGRLVEAVDATERYLIIAEPTDSHRADATARLASMRERLQRTGVQILTEVEGATILIDGEDMGRTPRRDPIQLAPGTHQLEIRLEGYHPFRSSVGVTGGMVADIVVELDPLPGTLVEDGPEMETVRPTAAYYVIGGGGAAIITGAMLGWAATNKADDAIYADDDDASSARTMAAVGDTLLFLGIGAAAGGILWLFLGSEEHEVNPSETAWRLTPVVGPGVVGADAQVRF